MLSRGRGQPHSDAAILGQWRKRAWEDSRACTKRMLSTRCSQELGLRLRAAAGMWGGGRTLDAVKRSGHQDLVMNQEEKVQERA